MDVAFACRDRSVRAWAASDFLALSDGSRATAEGILLAHPSWRIALSSARGIPEGKHACNLPTDQATGTAFDSVDSHFQVQPLPLLLFVSPLYHHSDIISLSVIGQMWISQPICSVHSLPSGMLVRSLHAFVSDYRNPVLRT